MNETRFVPSNVTECPRKKEELELTKREKLEIPIRYEGLVIGKHGANLLKISEQTGAEMGSDEVPYQKHSGT